MSYSSFPAQSDSYEPFNQLTSKHEGSTTYGFASPTTIQSHHQQPMMQAGGPVGVRAPPPPALPQLHLRDSTPLRLRTRDWTTKPHSQSYAPHSSLIRPSGTNSSRVPVYLNSTAPKTWGNRSIASTSHTTSPHTPSLLGVYDPAALSSQTSHLGTTGSHLPSSTGNTLFNSSANTQPTTYSLPQGGSANYGVPPTSTLPSLHSSGGLPNTHYVPSSTIPLSHNHHLPSSNLGAISSTSNTNQVPVGVNPYDVKPGESQYSNYPSTSHHTTNNLANNLAGLSLAKNAVGPNPYDVKPGESQYNNYPSTSGLSGISGANNLSSNYPTTSSIPVAPALPTQGTWKKQPYRQRGAYRPVPLRTKNWGQRTDNGWSSFNGNTYANESTLPFNANKSRSLGSDWNTNNLNTNNLNTNNLNTNNLNTNNLNNLNNNNMQTTSTMYAPTNYTTNVLPPTIQTTNIPLALAPIAGAPVAPLTGRKGRRAARRQAKRNAIQQRLTTQLAPPMGDPEVNHYRRGAPAYVPVTGPNGIIPQVGRAGRRSGRRSGHRHNLGPRRVRGGAFLPVPATQPPVVAPVPVVAVQPVAYRTVSSSIAQTGFVQPNYSTFNQQPLVGQQGFVQQQQYSQQPIMQQQQPFIQQQQYSQQPIVQQQSFAHQPNSSFRHVPVNNSGQFSSAGIPLSTSGIAQQHIQQQQQPLYSSAAQQVQPLSSTLPQQSLSQQPILQNSTGISQPLYSANHPVALGIMEKHEPAARPAYTRPTGSATF